MIVINAIFLVFLALVARSQTLKTDLGVYPEPALPVMGPAGSKITDPTFGTQILRLTDASFGVTECKVSYSTVPVFNLNNTRAYVRCSPYSLAHFFTFDSTNYSASKHLTLSSYPAGLNQYWLLWSGMNSDILYGTTSDSIYAINVATQVSTQIFNALSSLASGEKLSWQLSRSEDDNIFADTIEGSNGVVGYIVWRKSDGKVLLKKNESNINEVEVDKTGRYLVANSTNGSNRIWDLNAMTYVDAGDIYSYSHRGLGHGTVFTSANTGNLSLRSLTSPFNMTKLLVDKMFSLVTQDAHFSFLANNEEWGLASRHHLNGGPVVSAFDNEIVQIATDGSKRVRRIAHHRSVFPTGGYEDAPMANISRNGEFIAFTSNWGKSGRRDVYIVKIPPADVAGQASKPRAPANLKIF